MSECYEWSSCPLGDCEGEDNDLIYCPLWTAILLMPVRENYKRCMEYAEGLIDEDPEPNDIKGVTLRFLAQAIEEYEAKYQPDK